MKISLNWIKKYAKVDLPIDQLVDKIGSQLGAVEEVIDLGAKYQGAVVAKVVSCQNHSNADKLHVCLVDDSGVVGEVARSEHGLVTVVCGANNVAAGQTVIWLPPGVIVPETFGSKQPFKLEAKELRGVMSNGMIASARELDFGDDHSGIIVLDEDIRPGTTLVEALSLNDHIIDIENKMFTHRPDCFGILGVAREIAGIQQQEFKSPEWYLKEGFGGWELGDGEQLPLMVKNEAPDLVPRFMAIALSGINIEPSPLKMQTLLSRVGIKPINNIVDITNYIMYLTGQPLHAYDYDKVRSLSDNNQSEIIIRPAQKGEKITLLGGKTVEPREGAILITTSQQIIGIGGVMGGADTEVDQKTQNIILEGATFDMYSIRKTAFASGLFTDAVTRFSKGQSPLQNDKVLAKAVELVLKTGAQIASQIVDDNHSGPRPAINVSVDFINQRLGLELSLDEIAAILKNVEFKVELQTSNSELLITPPFWRTDIAIAEDVAEEVGRLKGFDSIPLKLPMRDISAATTNNQFKLANNIRYVLSAAGANELLTYSFVHGNLLDRVGQDRTQAYQLSNALSPDLQYYRTSLIPSLLEKVHPNIKTAHDNFVLFEIGKAHIKDMLNDEHLPREPRRLGLVLAADKRTAADHSGAPYFYARKQLDNLLTKLGVGYELIGVTQQAELSTNVQMTAPFADSRSALVIGKKDGNLLGVVGEFKLAVKNALKLPDFCAGFELNLDDLDQKDFNIAYQPLARFPSIEQDISLKVPAGIAYSQIEQLIGRSLDEMTPDQIVFKVTPLDIYQPEGAEFKHFAFRINITSYLETLKSSEVNQVLDQVAEAAKAQLQATRL